MVRELFQRTRDRGCGAARDGEPVQGSYDSVRQLREAVSQARETALDPGTRLRADQLSRISDPVFLSRNCRPFYTPYKKGFIPQGPSPNQARLN